jgi:hypothetical protein
MVFKWFSVASFAFVLVAWHVGSMLFSSSGGNAGWKNPWHLVVILTGVLVWLLPLTSLLEGCNQIAGISYFKLRQIAISSIASWLTMICGGGLWSIVAAAAANVFFLLYFVLFEYRYFFKSLLQSAGSSMSWRLEIWPMQWRLALSGLVNYLAFSLFNPVMFRYHGPIVAGQMGMTLQIVNAIQSIALVWVYTKVPRFGILVAERNYDELDRSWLHASIISVAVAAVGGAAVGIAVTTLNVWRLSIGSRLLPSVPMGLLLMAMVLMQVAQCLSVYLRAHKREPLVFLSVTSSLAIGFLVWLSGSRSGPTAVAASYLLVVALFIVPYEIALWFRLRSRWHAELVGPI